MGKSIVRFYNETIFQNNDSENWNLIIISKYNKEFLKPKNNMASGTVILFENVKYELIEKKTEKMKFTYYFKLYNENSLIRHIYNYTEDLHNQFVKQNKKSKSPITYSKFFLHFVLQPLYGFLPTEKQKDLENSTGLPAYRMTLFSSIIMMFFSIGLIAITMALEVINPISPVYLLYPIDLYIFLSTGDRFIHGFVFKEPLGPPFLSFILKKLKFFN